MAENKIDPVNPIIIDRSDYSIIDKEFSSIRESFQAEMLKMENEIGKLIKNLNPEKDISAEDIMNFKSPLITEEDNKKWLKLRFDVSEYDSHSVEAKLINNRLHISAYKEKRDNSNLDHINMEKSKKNKNRMHLNLEKEYYRRIALPLVIDKESLKLILTEDGVLLLKVQLKTDTQSTSKELMLPIDKSKKKL